LTRAAIISVIPAKNVSNTELEAELKKRLKSKLFKVERIAILDDEEPGPIVSSPAKQKQTTTHTKRQPQPENEQIILLQTSGSRLEAPELTRTAAELRTPKLETDPPSTVNQATP